MTLKEAIIEQVNRLGEREQRILLDLAKSFAGSPILGVSGGALLPFGGLIPRKELDQMTLAIEDACERIDEQAW
jgi:hypothetical protein